MLLKAYGRFSSEQFIALAASMATILPRRATYICQSCERLVIAQFSRRQLASIARTPKRQPATKKNSRLFSQSSISRNAPSISAAANLPPNPNKKKPSINAHEIPPEISLKPLNPAAELKALKETVARLTSLDTVPEDSDVLTFLLDSYRLANCLVFGVSKGANEVDTEPGEDLSAAILRDLTEDGSSNDSVFVPDHELSAPFRDSAAHTIAELAYTLLRDPKVYVSDEALSLYVRIQCLLGKPEFLPEIFHLHAHKKTPNPGTKPITFSETWPKLPKYAIPPSLADAALEAAILKKNLPLAIAIIDTSIASPANRNARIMGRAAVPMVGVASLPLLAYVGADWVAHWQNTMDVQLSKYTAIAGAMAYIGTLTTIGFVAITTSNDQMQRVVWRPGTKLSERWTREPERAMFDRLALAWGFQERSRWGEEQGHDWQQLKDECGLRDMILDKTELMEGMQ